MTGLSYAEAGVNIDAYTRALEQIKKLVANTHDSRVKGGVGPFAGLYELPGGAGYLAASADGVGTKIKIATAVHRHRGIGEDLVNHCVNDIATAGARPLFFLDYFACGQLDPDVLLEVVAGMADACAKAGCALLGGETAEMPGMYALGDYDMAGFIVGLVEPAGIRDPAEIRPGDWLVALPSSGLHTNGYSLVRRVFEGVPLDEVLPALGHSLADELLIPHRSYLGDLQRLAPHWKAAAHITGGGLAGNVARALPDHLAARLDPSAWQVPTIFQVIQQRGGIAGDEMLATFNMGLGMVLVMAPETARDLVGPGLLHVGEVVEDRGAARVIFA